MNDKLVDAFYDELDRRYSEPNRHYHGWNHVVHCLQEFDRVPTQMDFPDAVEMAIWFHDVVFTANAADNEKLSADLFSQFSKKWFSNPFIKKVRQLILITEHKRPPDEGDESYIVDIDFSSFGMPWPDYLLDTLNVRKEQWHKPDAVFYPAHARFLNMLLSRPRIFNTHFFHEHYEEIARRNINRLLHTEMYTREILECD